MLEETRKLMQEDKLNSPLPLGEGSGERERSLVETSLVMPVVFPLDTTSDKKGLAQALTPTLSQRERAKATKTLTKHSPNLKLETLNLKLTFDSAAH
jgi:hypothetical protein